MNFVKIKSHINTFTNSQAQIFIHKLKHVCILKFHIKHFGIIYLSVYFFFGFGATHRGTQHLLIFVFTALLVECRGPYAVPDLTKASCVLGKYLTHSIVSLAPKHMPY